VPQSTVRNSTVLLDVLSKMGRDQDTADFRLVQDENGFERVVYAELLIPEYLNTFNDFHTEKSVREFAYAYMIHGFSVDLEHEGGPLDGRAYVVESFVARDSDPDFIPGSWVIGVYVPDDDLWGDILTGEINGFSYRATVSYIEADMDLPFTSMYFGITEPDPIDGHQHRFFVVLDSDDKIILGGTDKVQKHEHPILRHTFTGEASGHVHIFNYVKRIGEE
jgi:hypothetical protein